MKVKLYKVKEGKLDHWKQWCDLLMTTYKNEALESLKEEGLVFEACNLFKLNEEYYVLGMAIGENLPANPHRKVNTLHLKNREECLEFVDRSEPLYEFKLN